MNDWQTIDLPKPLSTNNLFFNTKKGRVKSSAYCTWINAAGWSIKSRTPKLRQLREPCEVHLFITSSFSGDIDNSAKCVLDALQTFGVILNDKLITKLTIERAEIDGVRVAIRPFERVAA